MKQSRNILLGISLLLAMFLMLSITSATLVNPLTSSVKTGSIMLNATNTLLPAMVNCTFTVGSVSTANTSVIVGTATNTTFNPIYVNLTFNTAIVEDSNDYVFTALCTNSSASTTTSSVTGVTIDNTIPTAPTSISPTSNADGNPTISGTVNDPTTTLCTLYFVGTNPGQTSYSMTKSGSSCTKAFTAIPQTSYNYYVQASDGTNTSNSATTNIAVVIPSNGISGGVNAEGNPTGTPPTTQDNQWMWIGGGIIGIVILAWLIFKNN